MLDIGEVLRVGMRSAHLLAAMFWIGGSAFYLLVLQPALKLTGGEFTPTINLAFRKLVGVCTWVLLGSGVFLVFDRLTLASVGILYVVVLGIKIALSLWMFYLALILGQRRPRQLVKAAVVAAVQVKTLPPARLVLYIGMLVSVLGVVLTVMYEYTR